MTVKNILEQYLSKPIKGCPGRFMLLDKDLRMPANLVGDDAPVKTYRRKEIPDKIYICSLSDGGLISYQKADGTFVHTVNNPDGFQKKLAMLGIDPEK